MKKIVYLSALAFLISCHVQKESTKQQKHSPEKACKPLLLLTEESGAAASDPYQLDSLAVTNDCLELFVSYSGGCGEVDFEMYYTNKMMYSTPPQTVLFLHFKDDDPCRAIIQDTLYFNLSNFKELAASGGIGLRLRDSDKQVLFKQEN